MSLSDKFPKAYESEAHELVCIYVRRVLGSSTTYYHPPAGCEERLEQGCFLWNNVLAHSSLLTWPHSRPPAITLICSLSVSFVAVAIVRLP